VKAAIFQGNKRYLIVEKETPRVTRPEEAVIQVKACAICGSDIDPYFLSPEARGYVSGHEPAGIVTEIGDSVKDLAIGDSVVANAIVGCGRCEFCQKGIDSFCKNRYPTIGFEIDGGFAEYLKVPHYRAIFRFPSESYLR